MQTMLPGLGTGGRSRTSFKGTPLPSAAAFSTLALWLSHLAIRPMIRSRVSMCGMSFTASVTSTTVSPLMTPRR